MTKYQVRMLIRLIKLLIGQQTHNNFVEAGRLEQELIRTAK